MFYNCKKLVSINLSNFNTSNVENIERIFQHCESLVSLDLFNTPTTKITSLRNIFFNCYSLTSIDLSIFISTNNLKLMGSAFKNCKSLEYVNLSNLDTKKVETMDFMFYNCKSLNSLNLSNFDFSQVTWIESMFNGCEKLEYINLINFVERETFNTTKYANIFKGIPKNTIICLKEENTTILTSLIKNITCPIIYCGENWKQKQKQMKNCEIICDEEYPYLLKETKECVSYCDINKILSGECITKYKGNNDQINKGEKERKEEEIRLKDKFLDDVEKGFTSDNYNTSGLDSGKDEIVKYNDITITLTTTDNQKK